MIRSTFLALLLILACALPSFAYELFICDTGPCHWNQWPVGYFINAQGTEDLEDEFDIVQKSFARWEVERQTFCGIQFEYRGTTNIRVSEADGNNVVLWVEDADDWEYTSAALALTQCWYDETNAFHDCDILINGVDFDWADGENGGSGYDLRSTLTHEIGHLWGLDHSKIQAATMYEYYNDRANASDLDYDDILGARDVFCPEFELPEDDALEQNDTSIKARDLEEDTVLEPLMLYDDDWFALKVPVGKRVKVLLRDEDSWRPKTIYLGDRSGEILDSGTCIGDCNVALGDPTEPDAQGLDGETRDVTKRVIAIRGEFDENSISTAQYAIKVEYVNPGEEGELFDDDDLQAEGEELCGCDQGGAFAGTTLTFPPLGGALMFCLLYAVILTLRKRAARR